MTTIQVSMFLQFSVLGKGLEKGKGGLRLDRWGSGFQFKNPKINFAVTQSSLRTKMSSFSKELSSYNLLRSRFLDVAHGPSSKKRLALSRNAAWDSNRTHGRAFLAQVSSSSLFAQRYFISCCTAIY